MLDSVIVLAGPGVTLRVGTLVVRVTEKEPEGVAESLRAPLGTTLHYSAQVHPEYESLKVFVADTVAAVKGTIVLDETIMIVAAAQLRPRAETNRLYELLRAELTSKTPLLAFVAVECEMERLRVQYPEKAERWIHDVGARAHDPEKDGKGMRRLDDAMGGHVFGGCADDLKRYPATGANPDRR